MFATTLSALACGPVVAAELGDAWRLQPVLGTELEDVSRFGCPRPQPTNAIRDTEGEQRHEYAPHLKAPCRLSAQQSKGTNDGVVRHPRRLSPDASVSRLCPGRNEAVVVIRSLPSNARHGGCRKNAPRNGQCLFIDPPGNCNWVLALPPV